MLSEVLERAAINLAREINIHACCGDDGEGAVSDTRNFMIDGDVDLRHLVIVALASVRDLTDEMMEAARNLPLPDAATIAGPVHRTVPLPTLESLGIRETWKRIIDAVILP